MQAPSILVEGSYTQADLYAFKNKKVWKFKDIYLSQLTELFKINNVALLGKKEFETKYKEFIKERSIPTTELRGNYIYYPWSGFLLHTVTTEEQNSLRTNRAHNLITPIEQKRLGQFTAGVAGLSFGNGIALSLIYSGIANSIKLADSDVFETTNLNRVRVGLPSVDELKTTVTTQEIYEVNPHANVQVFTDGLSDNNLDDFVNGEKKLNIVFDVVDDFAMKVKMRLAAKKARIPVIMLTSLEDSILVDVERYDVNPGAEIFHGLLGSVANELLTKKMTEEDKARYAMTIVGSEHVSFRNLSSLVDIGKTLVSRPHLFSTVSIVCGLAAYIAKRIALGENMPSMRKHVIFNEILDVLPNKDDTHEARNEILSKFMRP